MAESTEEDRPLCPCHGDVMRWLATLTIALGIFALIVAVMESL